MGPLRGCRAGPAALRPVPGEPAGPWGCLRPHWAGPGRALGRPAWGNCSNRSNCSLAALVRGVVHQGRLQGSELEGCLQGSEVYGLQRMCGWTEAGTWHRGPGRWWRKEWLS